MTPQPFGAARRARLGVLVAALGALLAVAPVQERAEAAEAGDVEVSFDAITPTVLQPGQDLAVTVTLTNDGTAPVEQPRVLVHLSTAAYISRTSLDVWREASDSATAGRVVAEADLGQPLAPGASVQVTATVEASRVRLPRSTSSWGARGLAAEVVDVADPARVRLGIERTFVVWFPEQQVTPTTVSVLVPVTGPAPTADATAEVEALTARGGRLDQVLRATAEHPDVTWAVDPWLVQVAGGTQPSTDPAGTGAGDGEAGQDSESPTDSASPSPSSEAPSPSSAAWATRLVDAAADREVQALPWGDADVTALAHAGRLDLLDRATELSAATADDLGLPTSDLLVLPGETEPDLATAAATRGSALVVGPGALVPPALLTYTPSGVATLATARGDVTAVVADTRLSSALRTGYVVTATQVDGQEDGEEADDPSSETSPDAPDASRASGVTGATAAADLLAELAVVTRERPSDGRHLLAVLPRDWSPDPAVASAQLSALEGAPFVQLAPVAELAAAPATGVDRGVLPDRVVQDGEVAPAALDAVATAVDDRRGIATMVDDPSVLLGDLEPELLAPTALAWRADPARRTGLVARSQATTAALREAVSVPNPSDILLVSRSGELPLRVATTLDQDVNLRLRLEPSDSRLVADEEVEVTVPAGGEATVQVPVHGVQSADVSVRVVLATPQGVVVDDSTTLEVRVRAEWEGIGTAVAGVLLALGVVIGLVRTIRRGRRSRHAAAGPQPEPPPGTQPEPRAEPQPGRQRDPQPGAQAERQTSGGGG